MGMTPLEGLVMGTRAGDLDPGVVLELMRDHDRAALEDLLTRKSGLLGLTGTNDMRQIDRRAKAGDATCRLSLDIYAHRICKYLGAYAAAMGGVDVIAFTGGVGENNADVRQRCLRRLEFLGVLLDEDLNRAGLAHGMQCAEISKSRSRVRLFVLRADEELAMAEAIAALSPSPEGRGQG
jgi:acetate kinase